MEGSFESSGMGSGSTTSSGQVVSGFDSGFDNGIQKPEGEDIFNSDDLDLGFKENIEEDEVGNWDLMDIPGSAHDKLSVFSEMSDMQLEQNLATESLEENKEGEGESSFESEEIRRKGEVTVGSESELSFEKKIIQIQSDVIKLLAQSINKEVNRKEIEELIEKLKELMEKNQKEDGDKNGSILEGALGAVTLLLTITEDGCKKLEHELKETEK